jgi:hypothetical protein
MKPADVQIILLAHFHEKAIVIQSKGDCALTQSPF